MTRAPPPRTMRVCVCNCTLMSLPWAIFPEVVLSLTSQSKQRAQRVPRVRRVGPSKKAYIFLKKENARRVPHTGTHCNKAV